MGKNLIQQARGKGSPRYRAPSFKYKGKTTYLSNGNDTFEGMIIDFIHCRGHSAPLAEVKYDNGGVVLMQASVGIKGGGKVEIGEKDWNRKGKVMALENNPERNAIYNI